MLMERRRIAVFTGTRAEYGLLYPVLRAIDRDPRLDYRLLVGGAHLQEAFGGTVSEILADGLQVHGTVDLPPVQDTLAGSTRALGLTIVGLGDLLARERPDFVLVYGDRTESMAAVLAGTQMNLPTAHIEGGDYTEGGALDDSLRHAMTKLAHVHFATNAQARDRILKLGEEPWRVFDVGLPALDLIREGRFAAPEAVLADLGLDAERPVALFCQHSVATEFEAAVLQVEPSLRALERLAAEGWQVIITYPNNDAGGRAIIERLAALQDLPGITLTRSLGRHRFHGLLNVIGRLGRGCLAGNSSAGLKETPIFGCPAVNIGSRQQGRMRAANVLDVPYEEEAILQAMRRCVDDAEFRALCRTCFNPYGEGQAGPRIADVLATLPMGQALVRKKMTF
ncbi:UDP-N-acetyl glucosamine 2-epimerase [Mesoterricola silvestris]|uniref:UDP-N-acetyl glucosamine 2-epimerase n=2 Tax=Mesoterricola silvestris TaxID=2927979 RepID=A0AA48H323_9BACT|nr:UDP-N-acetyl glucosamine 2-epimerase [Mesoterricola silvestris]